MSSRKPSSLSNLLARLSHRSSKTPRLGDRLSTSNPDLVSTNIGDPPSYRAADDPDQAAPDYPSSPRPPPYDPPLGPPTSDPNYLGQLNRYNSATISVAKLEQSLVEFESQLTQYRTKWVKENPTKHADRFRALLIHLSKEEYNARRTSVDLAKTEMNLTKEVTEYFVKARPTLPISANPPSKSRKHHVCIPHEKLEEDLVVIDYLFPSDQDCDRLAKDALMAEVKETQERYSTLL